MQYPQLQSPSTAVPRRASTAGIRGGSGGADPSPRAQFLRASAAGVDAEAKEGQTGLHAAAEGGDAVKLNKLLRALRAVGADIASIDSTDRRLFTPFHVACAGDHAACVRALCAAGSDTAARNDAGQTGWDLAAYLERADVRTLPLPPSRAPLRVVERLPVLTRCGCR